MIRVHASNRMEILAEWLAEDMRAHPADALTAERIVVPHPLLGEWLRLELAARLGIAGHIKIELPAEFAWSVMREAAPNLPLESEFEPAILRWRIFDLLGRWDGDDPVREYLADGDSRKRFELADKLAAAYDRCMVFRPGAWNAENPSDWHIRLWSRLTEDMPDATHWIDAVAAYGQTCRAPESRSEAPKAYLFGNAMLSPSYVELLRHVGTVMDVHLFLLSPCRGFWREDRPRAGAGADGYYAEGNELATAWGRLPRDMQALLAQDLAATAATETYADSGETNLGAVQRDILERAAPGTLGSAPDQADDTIQIHVCHSATREVEVLHDRLLGIFDRHPDIQPADVLVLAPDLDAYAPAVEAVFGAAGTIPFNIGRQRARVGTAISALLDLLALVGSRYAASQVLAPLRCASVRKSFGLEESDLGRVREWVRRAGIRWGMDATHRVEQDVVAPAHNNWRHGLRRLLLAYAIPEEDVLIDGVAPRGLDRWGGPSGAGDYERLGRFVHYCELACDLDAWADDERTPDAWAERLQTEVLDRFFVLPRHFDPDSAREIDSVSRLIDDVVRECAAASPDIAVPFDVMRESLAQQARIDSRAAPRLADGVTVASLAAGQVFPAKVVCVLGMNDGAFPRLPPAPGFDFMQRLFGDGARRLGDRDVRDEDRFAFLEALLAARRCFVVSYTGRDLLEDKPIPPSVVVTEFADYLRQRFPAVREWEVRHPLQPFNRRYFTSEDNNLFSYSQAFASAARAVERIPQAPERFIDKLPSAPAMPGDEISLDELVRFSASPTKYFLRNRLGLRLDADDDDISDDEPFGLSALDSWQLRADVFEMRRNGGTGDHRLLAATGQLPPENLGRIQHGETARVVSDFAAALTPYTDHREEVEVDIAVDDFRIVGVVGQYHPEKAEMLWSRIGNVREKDTVEAWLLLLALTCAVEHPAAAMLLGSSANEPIRIQGPKPAQARAHLRRWLQAWTDGRREPLAFFPTVSWLWQTKNSFNTQKDWSERFDGGKDDYQRMVFGDDPQQGAFNSLAKELLGPLAEAMR